MGRSTGEGLGGEAVEGGVEGWVREVVSREVRGEQVRRKRRIVGGERGAWIVMWIWKWARGGWVVSEVFGFPLSPMGILGSLFEDDFGDAFELGADA